MNPNLPADLKEAEEHIYSSISHSIIDNPSVRLEINLKFEGLKILPLISRLSSKLSSENINFIILFSDPGSSALFIRDNAFMAGKVFTFKEIIENTELYSIDTNFFVVQPQPYDYELFYNLCTQLDNRIFMFNGKLEDSAVGIGLVARDRRYKFIKDWNIIYWLQPLPDAALMKIYPGDWQLFKSTDVGYKFIQSSTHKPDNQIIEELLQ